MAADLATLFSDTVHFDDALWRNIKGIRVSQNLFDDLSDDPIDHAYAVSAETLTKPITDTPLLARPFDYAQTILFPFEEANWQATRYSDGTDYGIWYGSDCLETTVYESVHHWVMFLQDTPTRTAGDEIIGERRVFTAACRGLLADLRGKQKLEPRLIHPNDYRFTRRLGQYAHAQGLNGMLTPSARHKHGFNGAILNQNTLAHPQDRCYLTYRWVVDSSEVRVERTPHRTWMRVAI